MLRNVIAVSTMLALVGCAAFERPQEEALGERVELRRPGLEQIALQEGVNVVDRAPSGLSLAAVVHGDEIVDWRVFDDDGEVVFQQRAPGDLSWQDACETSGGMWFLSNNPACAKMCCWSNWGCLCCTADEQQCEMRCDTAACRDANGQALPPVNPDDPEGRPSVAVNPDRLVIAADPDTPGWTAVGAAGVRMQLPGRKNAGKCPVCVPARGGSVCWEVACLPARIDAAGP